MSSEKMHAALEAMEATWLTETDPARRQAIARCADDLAQRRYAATGGSTSSWQAWLKWRDRRAGTRQE